MSSISEKVEQLNIILNTKKDREKNVIDFIKETNRESREEIRILYDQMFQDKPLNDSIKDNLSGNFRDLVKILFTTEPEFLAKQIDRSFGLRGNIDALFEILFTSDLSLLNAIRAEYQKLTNKTLENAIDKKFNSTISNFLKKRLVTQRRTNPKPDIPTCENMANELLKVKANTWLNSNSIVQIFLESSPEELIITGRIYFRLGGKNLLTEIEDMSSNLSSLMKTFLLCTCNQPEYFAMKLKESTKGLGTDTNLLNRCIASRFDRDLPDIKEYFLTLYDNDSLKDDIIDDTSGAYQQLLVYLIDLMN